MSEPYYEWVTGDLNELSDFAIILAEFDVFDFTVVPAGIVARKRARLRLPGERNVVSLHIVRIDS